jgi:hypothetical protein
MVGLRFRVKLYRAKAAEAEANARQAKDPDVRATYLKAAASWHSIADLLAEEALDADSDDCGRGFRLKAAMRSD